MSSLSIDPGLGEKFGKHTKRIINQDGSFNVKRKNRRLNPKDIYHFLVNLSWTRFLMVIFAGYLLVNLLFGSAYFFIGIDNLRNSLNNTPMNNFLSAYF